MTFNWYCSQCSVFSFYNPGKESLASFPFYFLVSIFGIQRKSKLCLSIRFHSRNILPLNSGAGSHSLRFTKINQKEAQGPFGNFLSFNTHQTRGQETCNDGTNSPTAYPEYEPLELENFSCSPCTSWTKISLPINQRELPKKSNK